MRHWLRFGFIFGFLCAAIPASAQSVQQSGAVTPGHAPCWVTDGVIKDCGLGFTEILNGSYYLSIDTAGHVRDNAGGLPTLTSCGTSPSISGTDHTGTVTMGTGSPTGCIITFATPYANAPRCRVTWHINIVSMQYSPAAAALTLTQTGTSSNVVDYDCNAGSGG